jgi:MOSC domain-containing protein YiiM
MEHLDLGALESGLVTIRKAPRDKGQVELVVRRPGVDQREVLDEARFDSEVGLVGDTWNERGSSSTPDGSANPLAQVTVMNARAAALMAGPVERWPLAGDQLYVDFDLSTENIPPGTRLAIGSVVLEVTDKPHTGCAKFASRFGRDALKFVNSDVGRALNLRGINTMVVQAGAVRQGDVISKTVS